MRSSTEKKPRLLQRKVWKAMTPYIGSNGEMLNISIVKWQKIIFWYGTKKINSILEAPIIFSPTLDTHNLAQMLKTFYSPT